MAYLASGLLHGGLALGLAWMVVHSAWPPAAVSVHSAVGPAALIDDAAAAVTSDDLEEGVTTPEEVAARRDALAAADAHDPQLSDFARQRLEMARADAGDRSAAENIAELDTLGQQLTGISSQESIAEISTVIGPWIGSDVSRATEPAPAVNNSEPFDVESAQISDVVRQEADGRFQFVAILVDAAGRTQETTLDPAEGESLFNTFQLMKKFPLLETVYRKTVMGLLDRLMEEQQATPATEAPSTPAEPSGDDHHAQEQD